jgi:hypothetical protein
VLVELGVVEQRYRAVLEVLEAKVRAQAASWCGWPARNEPSNLVAQASNLCPYGVTAEFPARDPDNIREMPEVAAPQLGTIESAASDEASSTESQQSKLFE